MWELEVFDGRIVYFDRIARLKWCTVEASLDTTGVSKVFYVLRDLIKDNTMEMINILEKGKLLRDENIIDSA